MDEKEKAVLRFNFIMGLLYGIFYNGGIAFGSATTVLPVFLTNFTISSPLKKRVKYGIFSKFC